MFFRPSFVLLGTLPKLALEKKIHINKDQSKYIHRLEIELGFLLLNTNIQVGMRWASLSLGRRIVQLQHHSQATFVTMVYEVTERGHFIVRFGSLSYLFYF